MSNDAPNTCTNDVIDAISELVSSIFDVNGEKASEEKTLEEKALDSWWEESLEADNSCLLAFWIYSQFNPVQSVNSLEMKAQELQQTDHKKLYVICQVYIMLLLSEIQLVEEAAISAQGISTYVSSNSNLLINFFWIDVLGYIDKCCNQYAKTGNAWVAISLGKLSTLMLRKLAMPGTFGQLAKSVLRESSYRYVLRDHANSVDPVILHLMEEAVHLTDLNFALCWSQSDNGCLDALPHETAVREAQIDNLGKRLNRLTYYVSHQFNVAEHSTLFEECSQILNDLGDLSSPNQGLYRTFLSRLGASISQPAEAPRTINAAGASIDSLSKVETRCDFDLVGVINFQFWAGDDFQERFTDLYTFRESMWRGMNLYLHAETSSSASDLSQYGEVFTQLEELYAVVLVLRQHHLDWRGSAKNAKDEAIAIEFWRRLFYDITLTFTHISERICSAACCPDKVLVKRPGLALLVKLIHAEQLQSSGWIFDLVSPMFLKYERSTDLALSRSLATLGDPECLLYIEKVLQKHLVSSSAYIDEAAYEAPGRNDLRGQDSLGNILHMSFDFIDAVMKNSLEDSAKHIEFAQWLIVYAVDSYKGASIIHRNSSKRDGKFWAKYRDFCQSIQGIYEKTDLSRTERLKDANKIAAQLDDLLIQCPGPPRTSSEKVWLHTKNIIYHLPLDTAVCYLIGIDEIWAEVVCHAGQVLSCRRITSKIVSGQQLAWPLVNLFTNETSIEETLGGSGSTNDHIHSGNRQNAGPVISYLVIRPQSAGNDPRLDMRHALIQAGCIFDGLYLALDSTRAAQVIKKIVFCTTGSLPSRIPFAILPSTKQINADDPGIMENCLLSKYELFQTPSLRYHLQKSAIPQEAYGSAYIMTADKRPKEEDKSPNEKLMSTGMFNLLQGCRIKELLHKLQKSELDLPFQIPSVHDHNAWNKTRMHSSDLVHIAGHCFPGDESTAAFIKLFKPGRAGLIRKPLRARSFVDDTNTAELVVLPGCSTGVGTNTGTHDPGISLAVSLLSSGVNCVVATAYPTYSVVNMLIMSKFYESLLADQHPSPSESLRSAQLWLKDSTRSTRSDVFKEIKNAAICTNQFRSLQIIYGETPVEEYLAKIQDDIANTDYQQPQYWAGFCTYK